MEILIYVSKITNRLFYIIELILKEELGINFKFTTDKDKYLSYDGPKLHYGKYPIEGENGLFQQSVNILFERDIADQDVKICKHNDTKAIFPVFNDKALIIIRVSATTVTTPHISEEI